jgi:hypothetical protein
MGLAMMLGTWVGKKYIKKLPKRKVYKICRHLISNCYLENGYLGLILWEKGYE